ncbi:hypothetical protein JCM24511_01593 [Saitozyma sp. JCM 24511]|nr:hypothetical protein JCM24511_01593 [Saitozyma sp. JCM 24511]
MVMYPKRPNSAPARWIWSVRVKLESGFGLAMLETWEKVLVWSTVLLLTFLFWFSVITYTPGHLAYLARRFSYYVFDDENVDLGLLFREMVKGWLRVGWEGVTGVVGGKGRAEL